MYICTYVYIYIYTYINIHVCTDMYAHIYVPTYTYMYVWIFVYIFIYTCICTFTIRRSSIATFSQLITTSRNRSRWWACCRSHIKESFNAYKWVMSQSWMSHITHMNASWRSHEWVMSRTEISRDTPVTVSRHPEIWALGLSCRSLSTKEPQIIGLFCGKWHIKQGFWCIGCLIRCRSLSAKKPQSIGLFCGKRHIKTRHLMYWMPYTLQVSFSKKATNYRAVLRKETYKNKASDV